MRHGLLRNRAILAVLIAETVSMTGSQMTWLAIPWFVLATTGSAARMGVVLAAEAVGVAVLGIPGGWLAGRLGARRSLLLANAVAAPLLLAIPVLHWAGLLSFGLLLALVFVTGGIWGPYFAAQRALLPEILGENEEVLSNANALLQAAQRGTMLLGPGSARGRRRWRSGTPLGTRSSRRFRTTRSPGTMKTPGSQACFWRASAFRPWAATFSRFGSAAVSPRAS